jgi:hypothetical protein
MMMALLTGLREEETLTQARAAAGKEEEEEEEQEHCRQTSSLTTLGLPRLHGSGDSINRREARWRSKKAEAGDPERWTRTEQAQSTDRGERKRERARSKGSADGCCQLLLPKMPGLT